MRQRPRAPAADRERAARGSWRSAALMSSSERPGRGLDRTASVASGVTSRGARPVPPVVSTTLTPPPSAHARSVLEICSASSGTTAVDTMRRSQQDAPLLAAYSRKQRCTSAPEMSAYTPAAARSLTVKTATRSSARPGGGGTSTDGASARREDTERRSFPDSSDGGAISSSAGEQQTLEMGSAAVGCSGQASPLAWARADSASAATSAAESAAGCESAS
eukprot:scaffold7914_cov118-Isochrysis_galbana.AAC.6